MSTENRSKRPRLVALGCAGLFGVLVLSVAGYLAWANAPLPPPEREPLPNPNGYDAVVSALRALDSPPGLRNQLADPERRARNRKASQRLLTEKQAELSALRGALRLPFRVPPEVLLDSFDAKLELQGGTAWLAGEVEAARLSGQLLLVSQRALDVVEFGVRLSTGGDSDILEEGLDTQLFGIGLLKHGVRRLSEREARAVGCRLEALIGQLPSDAQVLEGERYAQLSKLRSYLTQPEHFGSLLGFPGGYSASGVEAVKLKVLYWLYPKPKPYQELDNYYRALLFQARKPRSARTPVPRPHGRIASSFAPGFAMEMTRVYAAECMAVLRMLRVELALQEFRRAQGRYPGSLSELAPLLASECRMDPFSGKPFGYRYPRPPSRSPRVLPFLLYSAGNDGRDDGGRWPKALPNDHTRGRDIIADELILD